MVDFNAGMPVEELETQFETLYSEPTRKKLGSSNWKERLEGMEEVLGFVQEQETLQRTWEVLPSFYFLGSHFSNFQHVPISASASFLV